MELNKYRLLTIYFLLLLPILNIRSQSVEYFVKASFIEKFARFTEWETKITGDYFVIGIVGTSPFHNELEKLSQKTTIKNKPVKIVYFKNYEEISNCQLLFICASEKNNLSTIIKNTSNKSIMLVGDTPGFSEKGVHFNFFLKNNETLHFEINLDALVKSKLKTDMQLISIGKITN